jgi:hypothetical protein
MATIPSDPGDPGLAAARARLGTELERLTRLDLQVAVVAAPDDRRLAARDRARVAAVAAGRGTLLDDATAAAQEVTRRAFAQGGFSGTWAATDMAVSVATAGDRTAAAAAFEEAAMAAVVEDLVDDETLDVLRSTSDELGDLTGLPQPGSIASFTSPVAATLLIFLAGGSLAFAWQFGLLAVAIPGVMIAAIFVGLARRRPVA